MNNNLPRGATSKDNENQSSTNLSLSIQNKSILMSLISEFSRSGFFKSKNDDKQKCEAVSNALEVIENLSQENSLLNIKNNYLAGDISKFLQENSLLIIKNNELTNENNKQNETIKVLEIKNAKINIKNKELKTKMENSSNDYTANIDKKNESIKELEQRNIQTIKELSEFQTKKTTSGPEFNITNATGFVFNKESSLDDENFKEKYESANKIIQEKDVKINELNQEIVKLKLENKNQADEKEAFQKEALVKF